MEEKNPNGYEDHHFDDYDGNPNYRPRSMDEIRAQYGEFPEHIQKRLDEVAKIRKALKETTE